MRVDCHTHVFPPAFAAERDRYVALDPTFATLYGDPKARLATTDDLLRSMDAAGIDVSIVLGFAWRDLETLRRHNDYLLASAAGSAGRIVAFPNLPLASGADAVVAEAARCRVAGAAGFGELRPDSQGVDLHADAALADALVQAAGELPLLFHVSEPVGHAYAGKEGFALDAFYAFVAAHPGCRVIGAHWGGGLPFYASMPEVGALTSVSFDTAASSLLYGPDVYSSACALVGAERVLFGSDFPLLSQQRSRERIEASGLDAAAVAAVLGGNAMRLLGLGAPFGAPA